MNLVASSHIGQKNMSTQEAKDEWMKPEGYNTGIMVFNSITNRKEELILPKGKNLTWYDNSRIENTEAWES